MHRPSLAAALALLAVAGARAGAQGAPPGATPPRLAIATNPIAVPFGLLSLDLESATRAPGLTVGVAGTWLTDGRDKGWGDARVTYFPSERAFRGFAIGLTAGVVAEQGDRAGIISCTPDGRCATKPTETAPSLGVRMDYDWLVGARKRMMVGIGLGAKRTLKDVDSNRSELDQVYGDGRYVVGIVF